MAADSAVTPPQPAGGYGGGPPSGRFGPGLAPETEEKPGRSFRPLFTVALVIACLSTVIVILVVGLRRYVHVAKTAEARNSLAEIAKDAAAAHATEHRVCPSASQPIPLEKEAISARKYQSMSSEWHVDDAKHAGFSCLRFEYMAPQYYQYDYHATDTSFDARALGDLNGDGVFVEYSWGGHVVRDRLVIDESVTSSEWFFATGNE